MDLNPQQLRAVQTDSRQALVISGAEEWRAIKNFPDYQVSNLGRVKRIATGRILKPFPNEKGYLMVGLCDGGKKTAKVHLLVINAFKDSRPIGMTANHKNGKKSDNSADNLEWITHQNNVQHAHSTGLCGPSKGEFNNSAKLKDGEVWLIKKLLAESNLSLTFIAKMFKTTKSTIHAIKSGRNWEHIESCGEIKINKLLKEGEVWLIKRLIASGMASYKEIAKMFKVSGSLISMIANGHRWPNVIYP